MCVYFTGIATYTRIALFLATRWQNYYHLEAGQMKNYLLLAEYDIKLVVSHEAAHTVKVTNTRTHTHTHAHGNLEQ